MNLTIEITGKDYTHKQKIETWKAQRIINFLLTEEVQKEIEKKQLIQILVNILSKKTGEK